MPFPLQHTLPTRYSVRNFQSEADVSRRHGSQIRVKPRTITRPSILAVNVDRVLIQTRLRHFPADVIIRTNLEFKITIYVRKNFYLHGDKSVGREVGSSNDALGEHSLSLVRSRLRYVPWVTTDPASTIVLLFSLLKKKTKKKNKQKKTKSNAFSSYDMCVCPESTCNCNTSILTLRLNNNNNNNVFILRG